MLSLLLGIFVTSCKTLGVPAPDEGLTTTCVWAVEIWRIIHQHVNYQS